MGAIFFGFVIGFIAWFLVRYLVAGFYTVNQNERAVKTSFGRAERVGDATTAQDPIAAQLNAEEKERYTYPQVRVIPPGGPYFKWPWEQVYKVSIATQTVNMALRSGNAGGQRAGHRPRSRHQGPAQHRPERPDPLPRLRAQPLRLPLRREASDRARHGLLRLRPARAHRQLRGARRRGQDRRSRRRCTISPPPP